MAASTRLRNLTLSLLALLGVLLAITSPATAATAATAPTGVGARVVVATTSVGLDAAASPETRPGAGYTYDEAAVGTSLAAKGVADTAVGDAARACGLSFSPDTRVLLADGTTRPISQLKPGDLVVATDTHTGTTRTQTVQAVLINHDTDLLDVNVEDASGRWTTIHTTAGHPLRDTTRHAWVRAGVFPIGDQLRTIDGRTLLVAALVTPPVTSGEMWDLTITTDHDFYIQTGATAVLVHNSGCDEWAAKFAKENGGTVHTFDGGVRANGTAATLDHGSYGPDEIWFHHTVVLRDGLVHDNVVGASGTLADAWKALWPEGTNFGF